MKYNPSYFTPVGPGRFKVDGEDVTRFPVERVTWFDAVEFCNRLSKQDGFAEYYKLADVTRDGDSITKATVTVAGGSGYRLPTEAEWEFACREWSVTPYHFGWQNTGREANLKPGPATGYGGGPTWPALERTARVGSYKPNAYGLHDMHGNVAEWCWDWYRTDYYSASPAADPVGPDTGDHRVLRGGSWLVNESSCRTAGRYWQAPGEGKNYAGFRVARTP
jgi:formylglycine-generating enzyme required for sulfatase activity